jgi:putrescine transport system permease protein
MSAQRKGISPLYMMLAFGYAFLYAPIVLLVFYSFNESRLVTVWAGFSTKWYGELFRNEQILNAAWLSLRIAVVTATFSTILGTLAGVVIARHKRFPTRAAFLGLMSAPLVMPEVVMGLSLLLLFVALETTIGWPAGRGAVTVTIAHITFCLAFVAVIVQAKLASFDRSLEEAAMDLGAKPWKVFCVITLPLIAPALAAGWLLSFTLSFDDLIVTSFTSGPGASTLPMVIYSSVRLGVSPQINALATIMISVVAAFVAVSGWLLYRQDRAKRG